MGEVPNETLEIHRVVGVAEMRSSSEEGSYLRLANFCVTQLQAENNKERKRACLRKLDCVSRVEQQYHLGFRV